MIDHDSILHSATGEDVPPVRILVEDLAGIGLALELLARQVAYWQRAVMTALEQLEGGLPTDSDIAAMRHMVETINAQLRQLGMTP